jgi:AraC-like DNA-binding protein
MVPEGLTFGWRTALLAVAFIEILLIAIALARPIRNRAANRALAGLLAVLAGIITPWMIGFAGFYDIWPGLTFLPVQITLAVGPLAWLHVEALVRGRLPPRAALHLAPAAVQWLFLAASFCLPLTLKNQWAERIGTPYDVVTSLLLLVSLPAYTLACARTLAHYRAFLADERSDDHRFAVLWLRNLLVALTVLILGWTISGLWNLLSPLGYTGFMWLYLLIAAVAIYLGVEGWRHAHLPFPHMTVSAAEPQAAGPARDWAAIGRQWAEQVEAHGWDADPELSLPRLARLLGTNSNHLSRALNEGLGRNFSSFVNELRAQRVMARLAEDNDARLLDVALEAGFSSKASFNRAFLAVTGTTPSAYRRARSQNPNIDANMEIEAKREA